MLPCFGTSAVARALTLRVEKIASQDSTVLLTGESGTGKSLIARMIHYTGPLSEKLFVSINCSTLPHDLVESELFGQEEESLTNVHPKRPGFIEIAHGGTLFLDEMGDMPFEVQSKLLTFLREKIFYRVGGNKPMRAKVRIICATKCNLKKNVGRGVPERPVLQAESSSAEHPAVEGSA